MATYKQPCIHCDALIQGDARFCPACGSHSPFGYLCPSCLHPLTKEDTVCAGCGKSPYIACPFCKKRTFVGERCEQCGKVLMIQCNNPRCGELQFFANSKCTACGKKIKR